MKPSASSSRRLLHFYFFWCLFNICFCWSPRRTGFLTFSLHFCFLISICFFLIFLFCFFWYLFVFFDPAPELWGLACRRHHPQYPLVAAAQHLIQSWDAQSWNCGCHAKSTDVAIAAVEKLLSLLISVFSRIACVSAVPVNTCQLSSNGPLQINHVCMKNSEPLLDIGTLHLFSSGPLDERKRNDQFAKACEYLR